MEVQKSQFNLTLHLKIIYTFLLLNVTLCSFCLYLLFSRQLDNEDKLHSGKFNVTAENIQREKRDLNGPYQQTVG